MAALRFSYTRGEAFAIAWHVLYGRRRWLAACFATAFAAAVGLLVLWLAGFRTQAATLVLSLGLLAMLAGLPALAARRIRALSEDNDIEVVPEGLRMVSPTGVGLVAPTGLGAVQRKRGIVYIELCTAQGKSRGMYVCVPERVLPSPADFVASIAAMKSTAVAPPAPNVVAAFL